MMHTARSILGAVLLSGALAACQPHAPAPTSAQVEAVAMQAGQRSDAAAERRLQAWAGAGLVVAERELGMLYQGRPARRADAMALLEKAARGGDSEAAFALGEMYRIAVVGISEQPAKAAFWYRMAATGKHARAALHLALLAKNGHGMPRDDIEAAKWLRVSSELGNAHAMFLLSAAYQEGRGLPRDDVLGRHWLEQSAEHEYPPALQDLAMAMQSGDALSAKDTLRASHLLKEATEHRHNNWNRF